MRWKNVPVKSSIEIFILSKKEFKLLIVFSWEKEFQENIKMNWKDFVNWNEALIFFILFQSSFIPVWDEIVYCWREILLGVDLEMI